MRAIHFQVEDDLYLRIQEEADEQDLSVASFARVATIARALLWGVRRGAPWADVAAWGDALDIIQEVERRDISARRKLGAQRRESRTFGEKLNDEREQVARLLGYQKSVGFARAGLWPGDIPVVEMSRVDQRGGSFLGQGPEKAAGPEVVSSSQLMVALPGSVLAAEVFQVASPERSPWQSRARIPIESMR